MPLEGEPTEEHGPPRPTPLETESREEPGRDPDPEVRLHPEARLRARLEPAHSRSSTDDQAIQRSRERLRDRVEEVDEPRRERERVQRHEDHAKRVHQARTLADETSRAPARAGACRGGGDWDRQGRAHRTSMPMTEVTGNLFEQGLPALAHGCNTRGKMGAGIAREFARRYPEMVKEYQEHCRTGAFKLGIVWVWHADITVYNLATQVNPGRDARLEAIEGTVTKALQHAEARGTRQLGVPRIGAGIGGLPWDDVRDALREASTKSSTELVVVTFPEKQR